MNYRNFVARKQQQQEQMMIWGSYGLWQTQAAPNMFAFILIIMLAGGKYVNKFAILDLNLY